MCLPLKVGKRCLLTKTASKRCCLYTFLNRRVKVIALVYESTVRTLASLLPSAVMMCNNVVLGSSVGFELALMIRRKYVEKNRVGWNGRESADASPEARL